MLRVTPPLKKTVYKIGSQWLLLAASALLFIPSLSAQALLAPPPLSAASQERFALLKAAAHTETTWTLARDRAIARVINPDDYECGPTDFDGWFVGKLGELENEDAFWEIVINFGALDWSTFYKLVFDNNATDDYIGVDGRLTRHFKKRHQDGQQFWDVPTSDILLQGMHGIDLASDARMIPTVQFLFGISEAHAAAVVNYVQSVIEADAGLGYDHPFFTLNAYAFSSRGESPGSPFLGLPDKIVMGDGIMAVLNDVGLGANGPDFVFAHEFAHHVQYELGLLDNPVPEAELPEFIRRIELMADAFGAYHCAHARGSAFQIRRIVEVFGSAYLVGDCAFDFAGHHGTPNQREAAAQWGADLAASSLKRGQINPSALMLELFEQKLPEILAPDAP